MGSANAEAEPEVRTLLRKATREDVRRPQTGESVSRKNDMVVNLLREYKGRIAEYDRKRENLANQEKLLARYEQTGDTQEAMKSRNRMQLLQEQIARDEAYLAAREKTMQNVADVTRARLENERQQTALEQELDERKADALAARRESQQESAVQSAIRQQDTAALEQRAKSHKYGAVLTSYYMSGFEASGMDAEQYDRAVRAAYEQGADGWRFRRTDAQRGIADEVLQAAYNEGRQKGADNGTAGTQNSGKRDAGVDPGQPSGSVGKGAGTAAEGYAGGFGIQESLGIENRLRAAGAEQVSSKADGIANGTEAKTFRRVPDAMVQEYGALRQAKQILTDAGAADVRFVSGSLKIKTATGREISAQGVAQDGTVWISLSAKDGVLKTAEHEAMHVRLESETGLRERLISALGLSAEERDRLALKYCEAYEGCYTGEDLDAYLDEIVCDAYAGINRMGLDADKLQNAVRTEADRAASQSAKKPAQTRGPPARNSVAAKERQYEGVNLAEDGSVYTYEFLTSLPDMNVTTLPAVDAVRGNDERVDTAKVVRAGMKNARAVGTERDGKVFVQNDYTGRELRVTNTSIRHGLNGNVNRLLTNARLGANIGTIVKNAVPINALYNKASDVTGTYAMAAYATDSRGREFVAIVTVEQKTGNVADVDAYDVTHAVSGRQKNGSQADTKSQGRFPIKAATISIKDFLGIVNSTHQSILPQDVLAAFKETRNPKGEYAEKAKFSPAASPKENDKTALAYFGKTYKWSETGYVLLDGSKLDFSGRHEGGPGGYRSVDHRDISDAFDGALGDGSYTGGMVQFMQEGNIRISPESGGINLAVMPTRAQMDSLSDFISRERGEVILDIDDENGHTLSSTEYQRGTHANKVLQDIRNYFQSGQTPQASSEPTVQQFRLSPETQDANAEEETAEAKVYSYDKLPGKARQYVDAAVNGAVRQAANAMSIPGGAKRSVLKPAMQEMMREFLKTGTIAQETIDQSFERAYKAGVEEDREFYDANKFILDQMRTTGVQVPQEVRADIADFTQFRKRAMGRLLLNNEGLPVDTLYGELHEQAPGLFPEAIVNPSDQLQRMFEVADRIRVSKQTLDEAHRGDGGDFKRWAKNDFEAALEDMKASLRTARAWAESRERTDVKREAPKTQAEVQELYKRQKEAKRVYEKALRKNLLTDADERILDRLLRGEMAPEDIRDNPHAKSILNMYEAKADYAVLTAQIARWRSGVKEGYRAEVRPLLENTEQAKDKTGIAPGARYMRETMERNIEDVFPAADAAKINAAIFTPVHEQQAKSTKYKNEVRDRVRQLDLSRKVEKGNTVSEAHAVQLYGEATDNIRQLANKPMDAKRDGKTLAEWEAVVRELWESSPNLDRAKIENAVSEFRKIYDELFEKMNDVRVRNGYAPIDYRKGYFPHFQPGQTDGVLAVMGKALGIKADVTALPTSINGLTHTFKPGITWFGNAQERLGFNTAYDAVEGFDKYIEGAADIIFQTDNIQRLRAFTQELRYRTTDEGVRERVDAIRANEDLSEQDKELRIKDLYENAKFELSGLAVELDEYTNLLANKKSRLDRGVESVMGRGVYNVMNWLESRAAANMVAMNPGSWITNFIPLTQAWGYVPTTDMVRAMGQTIAAMKNDDGFWERSAFLTNRRGSDPLVRSWQDSLSAKLSSPMEWIDTFTADTIVRARYEQNIRRGMLEEDAMREADRFAANIMADRSKGATPTFFQSKNPAIKLFTQFQLEVNNQFSNIFKDLPREMRNRGLRALAVGLFKMFFGAWIYNELYEKIVGRRAALDPIDMTNDLVGDATGYKLNNIFDAATGAEDSVIRKDKPAGLGNTVTNFLTSTAEELPAIGGVLGGGRVPFSSALPDVSTIWKVATNKELDAGTKGAKLWEEVRDPLLYLGLPFGGGQVRKVAQGIMAVAQGGKFYRNNKGEMQMQYPVFTDEGVMTGLRTAQATIFGRNSTKEARDWVENDFSKLSTKETNAYLAMSAADVKQREAWKLIKAMQDVDVPEGASEKDAKLAALNASDASNEAKALYYYNVLASTKEQTTIEQMLTENADMGDYLEFQQEKLGVDGWQDADGKTVSGSKKSELYDLLDSYDFTPEQKDAIAAGNNYKLTGFEPWTEKGKALAEAVRYGKTFTRVLSDLRREGYTNGEISEAITALFRQEYIESDETERERLRRYLANAYERVGKSRKEALQKIDAWVQ